MRTYDFDGVKKTLKKNTFELEEQIKDFVGVTEKTEKNLLSLQSELDKLKKEFDLSHSKKRKEEIDNRVSAISDEIFSLMKKFKWEESFELCMGAMDILLVEGSSGLTKQNFSKFDAKRAFKDFFTAPQVNNED